MLEHNTVYMNKENGELVLFWNNIFVDKLGITFNLSTKHLKYIGKL